MLQLVNNLRLCTHQCNHMPGVTSNLLLIKKYQCLDLPYLTSLIGLVPFHPHLGMMLKVRTPNKITETKHKKKVFKISIIAKCNKCQGYEHTAIDCTSPVRLPLLTKFSLYLLSLKSLFLWALSQLSPPSAFVFINLYLLSNDCQRRRRQLCWPLDPRLAVKPDPVLSVTRPHPTRYLQCPI